jgi:hypothetical protein
MSSGNFSIGNGLSLEGFNHYMKTELEKYKAKITDVHCYQRDLHKKVLVSLIGDSTPEALERVVKISMEEALPKVEEDHKKYLSERNLSASLV